VHWTVAGKQGSLLNVDDVNRGLLGGGCTSADTNIVSHQLCLCICAESLIRRDKPTCPQPADLTSSRELVFPLSFV
jgi:hypothetical protein